MTISDETLCAQVFDRMVEAGDLGGDATLLAHAGSCMACFRVLGELRDAARLKEILRASPPAQPPAGDPLWDSLVARRPFAPKTPAAGGLGCAGEGTTARMRRDHGGVGVTLLAAAAAWGVLACAPAARPKAGRGVGHGARDVVGGRESPAADDASEAFDVGELDGAVLKRPLESAA